MIVQNIFLEFLFLLIGIIFIYYLSLTNQDLKFTFHLLKILSLDQIIAEYFFYNYSLNKIAGLYSSADILYNDFKYFSKEKKMRVLKLTKKI